jgi:S-adenosylmethionine synthetase
MRIFVRERAQERAPVEMVERKGVGHPDTICDALAEEFSLALSRFYAERCGAIQHHNVDKVLLRAGRSSPRLGGGRIDEPIEIYLAGRATTRVGGIEVPVEDLAREACETWLGGHLRHLDARRDVRLHCVVRPGSAELVELFGARKQIALANDTSLGVGFAPLTPLESAVLAVERALYTAGRRGEEPALGEDVKVMGTRCEGRFELTVACAMVDRHLPDVAAYRAACEAAQRIAGRAAAGALGSETGVALNAADDPASGRIYLTVSGTSAECGDDGEAGRGNRANGLITPYRPMTLESVAGKNPISHVGKLYNLAADRIAQALVREIPEIASAEVYLVSRIGHPVTEPALVDLALAGRDGRLAVELRARAEELARAQLTALDRLWIELLERRAGPVIV